MKKELSMDMLLNELNNNSLSNGEKAEILTTIIDLESEKPNGDMDLIRECLDYLADLNNEESAESAEQLPERLQRIYQKAAEEESTAKEKKQSIGRKRRFRKATIVAAIVAAILLITMTSLTVIARVNGYGNAWEMFADHWREYLKLGNGDEMTYDGFTFIRHTETKIYPDMESWLKEENLNILYPSVLPDGVRVEEIDETPYAEGEIEFLFLFNTQEIHFYVSNYKPDRYEIPDGMETIEANGYRFGILYSPELPAPYRARTIVDGFAYSIGAQDRDTLFFLLENLKKPGA